MASPEFNPIMGNMCAIFVTGKIYDELKLVFHKLAEGADQNGFKNCMICRLAHMDNFTINMAFSGYSW